MTKDDLENLDEQVKSQHEYWESLSPQERRVSVIQMRDAQSKNAQKSGVFLIVIGLLFSAATIHFWLNEYNMSLGSTLGIVCGGIFAMFGFKYLRSNRIKSYAKIQTDDFSDEDVITYFREHERVNQRALMQLKKNKFAIFALGIVLILLANLYSTREFIFMSVSSGLSIFLVGIVVFTFIQKAKPSQSK